MVNSSIVFIIMHTELNLLRNVDANNPENSTMVKNSSLLSGFRGGSSYNHETETIFALPRMQLDFKSIHVQEPQEPSLQGTQVLQWWGKPRGASNHCCSPMGYFRNINIIWWNWFPGFPGQIYFFASHVTSGKSNPCVSLSPQSHGGSSQDFLHRAFMSNKWQTLGKCLVNHLHHPVTQKLPLCCCI